MRKSGSVSRSTRHRRLRLAKSLGCHVDELPDLRGTHTNHRRGANHPRWRGGNPQPDKALRLKNAIASAKKHPEKVKAREGVHAEIRAGRLPHPSTLKCSDCNNPATSYDHHNGYSDALDVEAVCFKCHGKRSVTRGEHRLTTKRKTATPIPDDLMVRQPPWEASGE